MDKLKKNEKKYKSKINKYIKKYNLELDYNDKFTVKIFDIYNKLKTKNNKNFNILLKIAINLELFYIFLENIFSLFHNNSSLKQLYILDLFNYIINNLTYLFKLLKEYDVIDECKNILFDFNYENFNLKNKNEFIKNKKIEIENIFEKFVNLFLLK